MCEVHMKRSGSTWVSAAIGHAYIPSSLVASMEHNCEGIVYAYVHGVCIALSMHIPCRK